MMIVAHLRPILSAKIPAGRAPRKAPTARYDPTQLSGIRKILQRQSKFVITSKLIISQSIANQPVMGSAYGGQETYVRKYLSSIVDKSFILTTRRVC